MSTWNNIKHNGAAKGQVVCGLCILIFSTDISKNKGTGRLVYDCSSFLIGLKFYQLWNPASSAWTAVCERRIVFCGMLILIYVRVWSLTMKMYGRSPASPALARWEGEIKLGTIYVGTRRRFTFQLCRRVEDWEENISPNLKFNCNNKSHNSVSVCHCIMHAWSPYPYPYFVKSVLCLWKSRNVPIVVWQ